MKHNHPNAQTIAGSKDSFSKVVCAAEKDEVKKYMEMVDFNSYLQPGQAAIYNYIRDAMKEGLFEKSKHNVIFAALIERIARTASYLDMIEKDIFNGNPDDFLKQKPSEYKCYLELQAHHMKALEHYTNLRFADEKKSKGAILEKLRETVRLENYEL